MANGTGSNGTGTDGRMGEQLAGLDPAQFSSSAQRLRQLAGALRARADRAEHLLDGAQALDNATTWRGSYPDQTHRLLGDWKAAAGRTADAIRDHARRLDTVASGYEVTAAALRRVAAAEGSGGR